MRPPDQQQQQQQQRPPFRRGTDRMIGGVCSGMAAGFRIDVLWVRLAFVVLAFLQGVGVFIYIVLWLVMPEDTEAGPRSGFDSVADDLRRVGAEIRAQLGGGAAAGDAGRVPVRGLGTQGVVLGVVLVIMGGLLLGVNTGLLNWNVIWPVAVIAIGLAFLLRGLGRRA